MFSRKKNQEQPKKSGEGKGQALMQQMGLMPDMLAGESMDLDDDDDDDLEAELLALQNESQSTKPKKKRNKHVPIQDLDNMVAASMQDIGSDDDDIDEQELMAELLELEGEQSPRETVTPTKPAPVIRQPSRDQMTVITDRLEMYKLGEANAKAMGETSKSRRLNRGVKTLEDILRKARAGRHVDDDDIPPAINTSCSKPPSENTTPDTEHHPGGGAQPTLHHPGGGAQPTLQPTVQAPTVQPPTIQPSTQPPMQPSTQPKGDATTHKMLEGRRDQYKTAALHAKKLGDNVTAVKYIKISKQFDQVIGALEKGDPIDLSKMPPPPPSQPVTQARSPPAAQPMERSSMQASAVSSGPPNTASTDSSPEEEIPELSTQEKKKLFNAPESAGSVGEALQQRLEKYKATQTEAQQEGNSSKARRMARIVKQYEVAVKNHKASKPVDYDDLPVPPGFPPMPIPKAASPVKLAPAVAPAAAATGGAPTPAARHPVAGPPPVTQRPKVQRQLSTMSRAEQQTIFLQERQLQFKKAAMNAKTNGDMELAKKYLRMAKGFDQMIGASQSGLPVDMTQIPKPPSADTEESFEFVSPGEIKGDRGEMYKKLEQELIQQIKTCSANADSFTHLGDVSSATKFDKLGQNCRKDLDALMNAFKHGDPVPRFHYENRQFSMLKCCADLGDNDLEIILVRGLDYGLPSGYQTKDMDTYVKFEFPFPNDDPQCGTTDTHKHTISPDYNQSFKVQINRKSRVFQRLLKSTKTIKFEVFYKRGFLKSDKLIGCVNYKLTGLDSNCQVHESQDLMDGRKACGGRLEFKIRIRDPFGGKQVEEVKEKWLIIDLFYQPPKPQQRAPQAVAKATSSGSVPPLQPRSGVRQPAGNRPPAGNHGNSDLTSMEVLKYEKQQLDTQIRRYQGRLSKSEEESLQHKGELLLQKVDDIKARLQKGGTAAWKGYADAIEKTQAGYVQEAKVLSLQGNRDKATLLMTKKKLVEKEVEVIRSKLPAGMR